MKKILLSSLIGLFFLALIVVWGRYVWKLQVHVNSLQEELHKVSTAYTEVFEQHSSAQKSVENLTQEVQILREDSKSAFQYITKINKELETQNGLIWYLEQSLYE